jgi:hypothetical protein
MDNELVRLLQTLPPDDLRDAPNRIGRIQARARRRRVTTAAVATVGLGTTAAVATLFTIHDGRDARLVPGTPPRACSAANPTNRPGPAPVRVDLTLPHTAQSGSTIEGTVALSARTPYTFETNTPVWVLLRQGDSVVGGGYFNLAVAGVGRIVNLKPGKPAMLPVELSVRGCLAESVVVAGQRTRPHLPAGVYQAVAVLDDHPVGQVHHAQVQLVSEPLELEVTRPVP